MNLSVYFVQTLVLLDIFMSSVSATELKQMGAVTCASSGCHGKAAPSANINILGNESTVWLHQDAHSRAWKVLTTAEGIRIGKNYGVDHPEKASECLKCHASSAVNLGPRFRIEDGVQCEICHGAAEAYLNSHYKSGATFEQNLKAGLQDLREPFHRAQLCLQCHQGDVDHRLYSAGHPRLTFELDTFTEIQPAHWNWKRAEYLKRKGKYNPVEAWIGGQLLRADGMLKSLEKASKEILGRGFAKAPDFSVFYCYSCHHSLDTKYFLSHSAGSNSRPSEKQNLEINLSSLQMAALILAPIETDQAKKFSTELEMLRSDSDPAHFSKLREILRNALEKKAEWTKPSRDPKQISTWISALIKFGTTNPSLRFEDAEQIAMGLSALASGTSSTLSEKQIDRLYLSMKNIDRFDPTDFKRLLGGMGRK